MEYVLETKNLEKKYGKFKALDYLDMHVKEGSIYGLIGKNGAGKTTLIRVACGLQNPSGGSYSIYGINYSSKKIVSERRRMNAIIESPSLFLNLSAKENLIEQYKILGLPSLEGIDELLELVGLENVGEKRVKNFSLGMRQRLGIAITLAGNPDFLLLDEPINGLDPEGIIAIREIILKLNRERGITFLISSHYLDELSKIATCYGFMENGKMIKEIEAEELEKIKTKKTILIVNDTSLLTSYLDENHISYEIESRERLVVYDEVDIAKMILELKNENLVVKEIKEVEESLESYYLNLLGGSNHDKPIKS